jgi:hypothetical protein
MLNTSYTGLPPIQVAAHYKAWDCGRLLAGTAGSNTAGGMDIYLLLVLCVVRQRSLRQGDHYSRGVLQSAVCVTGYDRETSIKTRRRPTEVCYAMGENTGIL